MELNPGQKKEYVKRHDAIWPELKTLLLEAGIRDYSIFLDEKTNILKRHTGMAIFGAIASKVSLVDKGETLINCLAYIDLNPLRAGIVSRPEDYHWNFLGYHVQMNNRDNFLSTDFGLKEFNLTINNIETYSWIRKKPWPW